MVNEIEKEKHYEYLEPKGTIYCLRDLDYNVLLLDIEFEGWIPNQVRIWHNEKNPQKGNVF